MSDVTANVLCTAAMRKIRAIDPAETPSSTELDNCYTELKRMLKSWVASGMAVYVSTEDTHTLSSGTSSYTIGSGATIDTERPVRVLDGSYVLWGGLRYPLKIVGEARFNILANDNIVSTPPQFLWYKPDYANGVINLWPAGGGTLYLYSHKYLSDPATVDNDCVFPEEYQDAIVWNLAARICPEFIGDPSAYIVRKAAETFAIISNLNLANNLDEMDIGMRWISGVDNFNIDVG